MACRDRSVALDYRVHSRSRQPPGRATLHRSLMSPWRRQVLFRLHRDVHGGRLAHGSEVVQKTGVEEVETDEERQRRHVETVVVEGDQDVALDDARGLRSEVDDLFRAQTLGNRLLPPPSAWAPVEPEALLSRNVVCGRRRGRFCPDRSQPLGEPSLVTWDPAVPRTSTAP